MHRVLFVCLGNICRSPMAEALFRHHVAERGLEHAFAIDSAGTGGWHVGEPPHPGTRDELARHGISTDGMTSRKVDDADFYEFDLLLAMDESNYRDLTDARLDNAESRIAMLMDWAPQFQVRDVPDPYYAGGFDRVYEMIDAAASALVDDLAGST